MVEPTVVKREFPAQWAKVMKPLDKNELGRLRFVEKWGIEELSKYFKCHRGTILRKLAEIRTSWA